MSSVTETRTSPTQKIYVRNKLSATLGNNDDPKATVKIANYPENVNIQHP